MYSLKDTERVPIDSPFATTKREFSEPGQFRQYAKNRSKITVQIPGQPPGKNLAAHVKSNFLTVYPLRCRHSGSNPEMSDIEFITVAKVGAIAEGTGETFTVKGRMVAVFCENGEYQAIDDLCPHMGASLAGGYREDGVVACPWHAWRFRTCDGTWCDNPKLKVDSFPVRVVDDEIQVAVPPKVSDPPGSDNSSTDSNPSDPA